MGMKLIIMIEDDGDVKRLDIEKINDLFEKMRNGNVKILGQDWLNNFRSQYDDNQFDYILKAIMSYKHKTTLKIWGWNGYLAHHETAINGIKSSVVSMSSKSYTSFNITTLTYISFLLNLHDYLTFYYKTGCIIQMTLGFDVNESLLNYTNSELEQYNLPVIDYYNTINNYYIFVVSSYVTVGALGDHFKMGDYQWGTTHLSKLNIDNKDVDAKYNQILDENSWSPKNEDHLKAAVAYGKKMSALFHPDKIKKDDKNKEEEEDTTLYQFWSGFLGYCRNLIFELTNPKEAIKYENIETLHYWDNLLEEKTINTSEEYKKAASDDILYKFNYFKQIFEQKYIEKAKQHVYGILGKINLYPDRITYQIREDINQIETDLIEAKTMDDALMVLPRLEEIINEINKPREVNVPLFPVITNDPYIKLIESDYLYKYEIFHHSNEASIVHNHNTRPTNYNFIANRYNTYTIPKIEIINDNPVDPVIMLDEFNIDLPDINNILISETKFKGERLDTLKMNNTMIDKLKDNLTVAPIKMKVTVPAGLKPANIKENGDIKEEEDPAGIMVFINTDQHFKAEKINQKFVPVSNVKKNKVIPEIDEMGDNYQVKQIKPDTYVLVSKNYELSPIAVINNFDSSDKHQNQKIYESVKKEIDQYRNANLIKELESKINTTTKEVKKFIEESSKKKIPDPPEPSQNNFLEVIWKKIKDVVRLYESEKRIRKFADKEEVEKIDPIAKKLNYSIYSDNIVIESEPISLPYKQPQDNQKPYNPDDDDFKIIDYPEEEEKNFFEESFLSKASKIPDPKKTFSLDLTDPILNDSIFNDKLNESIKYEIVPIHKPNTPIITYDVIKQYIPDKIDESVLIKSLNDSTNKLSKAIQDINEESKQILKSETPKKINLNKSMQNKPVIFASSAVPSSNTSKIEEPKDKTIYDSAIEDSSYESAKQISPVKQVSPDQSIQLPVNTQLAIKPQDIGIDDFIKLFEEPKQIIKSETPKKIDLNESMQSKPVIFEEEKEMPVVDKSIFETPNKINLNKSMQNKPVIFASSAVPSSNTSKIEEPKDKTIYDSAIEDSSYESAKQISPVKQVSPDQSIQLPVNTQLAIKPQNIEMKEIKQLFEESKQTDLNRSMQNKPVIFEEEKEMPVVDKTIFETPKSIENKILVNYDDTEYLKKKREPPEELVFKTPIKSKPSDIKEISTQKRHHASLIGHSIQSIKSKIATLHKTMEEIIKSPASSKDKIVQVLEFKQNLNGFMKQYNEEIINTNENVNKLLKVALNVEIPNNEGLLYESVDNIEMGASMLEQYMNASGYDGDKNSFHSNLNVIHMNINNINESIDAISKNLINIENENQLKENNFLVYVRNDSKPEEPPKEEPKKEEPKKEEPKKEEPKKEAYNILHPFDAFKQNVRTFHTSASNYIKGKVQNNFEGLLNTFRDTGLQYERYFTKRPDLKSLYNPQLNKAIGEALILLPTLVGITKPYLQLIFHQILWSLPDELPYQSTHYSRFIGLSGHFIKPVLTTPIEYSHIKEKHREILTRHLNLQKNIDKMNMDERYNEIKHIHEYINAILSISRSWIISVDLKILNSLMYTTTGITNKTKLHYSIVTYFLTILPQNILKQIHFFSLQNNHLAGVYRTLSILKFNVNNTLSTSLRKEYKLNPHQYPHVKVQVSNKKKFVDQIPLTVEYYVKDKQTFAAVPEKFDFVHDNKYTMLDNFLNEAMAGVSEFSMKVIENLQNPSSKNRGNKEKFKKFYERLLSTIHINSNINYFNKDNKQKYIHYHQSWNPPYLYFDTEGREFDITESHFNLLFYLLPQPVLHYFYSYNTNLALQTYRWTYHKLLHEMKNKIKNFGNKYKNLGTDNYIDLIYTLSNESPKIIPFHMYLNFDDVQYVKENFYDKDCIPIFDTTDVETVLSNDFSDKIANLKNPPPYDISPYTFYDINYADYDEHDRFLLSPYLHYEYPSDILCKLCKKFKNDKRRPYFGEAVKKLHPHIFNHSTIHCIKLSLFIKSVLSYFKIDNNLTGRIEKHLEILVKSFEGNTVKMIGITDGILKMFMEHKMYIPGITNLISYQPNMFKNFISDMEKKLKMYEGEYSKAQSKLLDQYYTSDESDKKPQKPRRKKK